MPGIEQHGGSKYLRTIHAAIMPKESGALVPEIKVDVYCVLKAFNVHCPATQHAIKKLLCAGLRNKADRMTDLKEAIMAMDRAVDLEECRQQRENLQKNLEEKNQR